jgi:hypothetical protein
LYKKRKRKTKKERKGKSKQKTGETSSPPNIGQPCFHMIYMPLIGVLYPRCRGLPVTAQQPGHARLTSGQTTGDGCPMPGMAPPLSDGRKGAGYSKGIPRGQQATPHGPRNLPGTKQQTNVHNQVSFEGAALCERHLTSHDDTSHALQPKGSRYLDSKASHVRMKGSTPFLFSTHKRYATPKDSILVHQGIRMDGTQHRLTWGD